MNEDQLNAIAQHYAEMSEPELMDLARIYDELIDPVQTLLREEFKRRSLEPPLLDDLPQAEAEQRVLVTIRTYRDLPEAFVARAVLQEAGIFCFLQNEHMIGLQWSLSNALGGAALQVAEDDVDAAVEVLSQPIPEGFAVDSGEDFVQPVCPQCGSLDVMANDTDRKIRLASTLVLGLPLIVGIPALAMLRKDVWKCNHCGCRWTDDGDPSEEGEGQVFDPLR